ncbi:MAG TPA: respiratory nitrate reductase subunit gamma [Anaeromyxobacteraceae bacterium]
MTDLFLFGVFPYLAVALAAGGVAYRYRVLRHTVTTRSSQLLESRTLYWGSVPWHGAILVVLLAHLGATLFPGAWARLLGEPARLLALEVSGLALGALAVFGIAVLAARRLQLGSTTSAMDWAVLALLFLQAATGLYVAFALRWGGAWYVQTAAPWLASLATLAPQVDRMAPLPRVVKLHAVNAFLLLALLPPSKLVHLTSVPIAYLWRAPQRVLWRRAPKVRAE